MRIGCRPANSVSRVSRRTSAPAGLWAPSSRIWVPSAWVTHCNRPGQDTAARPARRCSGVTGRMGCKASTVASARAALFFWCRPIRPRGKDARSAVGGGTSTSGAPFFCAVAAMTARASGDSVAVRTGTPGLMMPAFSAAIFARVSPSQASWSKAMLVMTLASGVTMLVASSRPPRPVSQITRSQCCSANHCSARTVVNSNRVTPASPFRRRRVATRRARSDSGISVRLTWRRSRKETRCGDV